MFPRPAEQRLSTGAPGSASRRFRRQQRAALGLALALSALLHLLLLALSPRVTLPDDGAASPEVRVVRIQLPEPPPAVEPRPAPEPVRRPAPPATGGGGEITADDAPAFIPHDVPPRLVNGDEVRSFLRQFYPPVMKALGVQGRVLLWLYLDERGNVLEARVRRSSGHRAFDELARTMAPLMRFRPALNQGHATPVWVSLPLRFELRPDPNSLSAARGAESVPEAPAPR